MLSVKVPMQKVRAFAENAEHVHEAIVIGLAAAGMHMLRAVKEATPVGVTGILQASWAANLPRVWAPEPSAAIFTRPAAVHGIFVEGGTSPHWAPLAPLELWARKKLGISRPASWRAARALQRSIARMGTRGQFFATLTVRTEGPAAANIFEQFAMRFLLGGR